MLILLFVVIVLSPCVVAFLGGADAGLDVFGEAKERPRPDLEEGWVGPVGAEQQVMLADTPLAEGFAVRSFPKGLAQRRLVLQDRLGEVRLHIRQLRAAAWEQMRLAGLAAERFVIAAERAAVTRAVLLKRLAEEARSAWERSAALRAREARMAAEGRAGWSDAEAYARWRWRESGRVEAA